MHVTIYGNSLYTIHNLPSEQVRQLAAMSAHKTRHFRSAHPQRDPGPPLGQPQPARSHLGDIQRTKRRRSRAGEIAPSEGAFAQRSRRGIPAALLAAEGAPRARRTPPTLASAARPLPAAAARVCWPLRLTQAPCGPHGQPPRSLHAGPTGSRRRRCDDTETCPSAVKGGE